MKIILSQEEMLKVVRRSFPPEMIPTDYEVDEVEAKGYPVSIFEITLSKKEEVK